MYIRFTIPSYADRTPDGSATFAVTAR